MGPQPYKSPHKSTHRQLLVILAFVGCWLIVAAPVAYHAFMTAERQTVIAGHDATVSPTTDGFATVDLGAYLPNVRYPTDQRLGVDIEVGKTNVDSYNVLLQRYALIASHPEGEVAKVADQFKAMAWSSLVEGALVGLAGPAVWGVVGRRRRAELAGALTPRRLTIIVVGLGVAVGAMTVVLQALDEDTVPVTDTEWAPIATLVPDATLPEQAQRLQVQGGLVTSGTQRLIQSAFDSFKTSSAFYSDIAERAADLEERLRQPGPDEVVALLVSDRHDNIGMDGVVRAIAAAGGASMLLDAGDDTSTGEPWEAFSLDSLVETFDDLDQAFVVPGNHDNGEFVPKYFAEAGFTVLTGEPIETTEGIWLLGIADPRSSGLGSWRTEVGISFDEQADELADTSCAADAAGNRVSTLLVHDANLGEAALERGCVDLLLAGHLHRQVGPTEVDAVAGQAGVTYTNGTTGGAAYAVALGTKLRRDAQVTLVTYQDGRAIGLQPVTITVTGDFEVAPFAPMPWADER
ncbi:MAG: metallophosphoesterase [Nocardioidaceae bacterium]